MHFQKQAQASILKHNTMVHRATFEKHFYNDHTQTMDFTRDGNRQIWWTYRGKIRAPHMVKTRKIARQIGLTPYGNFHANCEIWM